MANGKDGHGGSGNVEVMLVDVSEEQGLGMDIQLQHRVLENAVNKKLNQLQAGTANAIGERFQVEILDVKYISPSAAMIIANDRSL